MFRSRRPESYFSTDRPSPGAATAMNEPELSGVYAQVYCTFRRDNASITWRTLLAQVGQWLCVSAISSITLPSCSMTVRLFDQPETLTLCRLAILSPPLTIPLRSYPLSLIPPAHSGDV